MWIYSSFAYATNRYIECMHSLNMFSIHLQNSSKAQTQLCTKILDENGNIGIFVCFSIVQLKLVKGH